MKRFNGDFHRVFLYYSRCLQKVGYFLAPPFGRRLFDAGLSAPSCFERWDVLAPGCFGASQFRQVCVIKMGHEGCSK